MLREGDKVAPGLKLEQITPEGMISGYKGYGFRRGVKQDSVFVSILVSSPLRVPSRGIEMIEIVDLECAMHRRTRLP